MINPSTLAGEGQILNYFEIDLFNGISADDQVFLNKQFNRRHLPFGPC